MRKVLPIFAITVALLGCTMNRTPGNGQPVTATPSTGPAATPGTSYGNVPMTSSYTLPTRDRATADQAAAILREHQAYRGRVLGYLSPVPAAGIAAQQRGVAGVQQPTGLFISPAAQVNPQLTVNSSISSQPVPVVSSGAGDGSGAVATTGAFVLPGGATSAGATTGTTVDATGAVTAASTIGNSVAGTTAALSTPTNAATAATPGTATAINAVTPTMSSGATASPIASTGTILGGTGRAAGNVVSTGTVAANSTVRTNNTTSTNAVTSTTSIGAGITAPLVIRPTNANAAPITVTNNGGQITISNVRIK